MKLSTVLQNHARRAMHAYERAIFHDRPKMDSAEWAIAKADAQAFDVALHYRRQFRGV